MKHLSQNLNTEKSQFRKNPFFRYFGNPENVLLRFLGPKYTEKLSKERKPTNSIYSPSRAKLYVYNQHNEKSKMMDRWASYECIFRKFHAIFNQIYSLVSECWPLQRSALLCKCATWFNDQYSNCLRLAEPQVAENLFSWIITIVHYYDTVFLPNTDTFCSNSRWKVIKHRFSLNIEKCVMQINFSASYFKARYKL